LTILYDYLSIIHAGLFLVLLDFRSWLNFLIQSEDGRFLFRANNKDNLSFKAIFTFLTFLCVAYNN
jgi:hypothetical protein